MSEAVAGTGEGAAATAEAAASPAASGTEVAVVASPVRPEGLPDDLWEEGKGVKLGDLWTRAQDATRERDELKASRGEVPADAAGYELKVPEGVTLPAGVTLDPADPFLKDAQAYAKTNGWTKPQFQQAVALEAMRRAGMATAAAATRTTEMSKLGANASARVDAVKTWAGANLPSDQASALMGSLHSAASVQAVETLIARGPKPGQSGGNAPTGFDNVKGGADRLALIRQRQNQAA